MEKFKTLRTGTLLNDDSYRVEEVIGTGGFGITYRAVHVILGKKVAIKEFFIEEFCVRDAGGLGVLVAAEQNRPMVDKFKKKFIHEARLVAKMKHRNIIDVFDVFEENGTAYYVMEYLSAGSLEGKVQKDGALPEEDVLKIISQLGSALKYIHENKVLHLDIKPANILINDEGEAVLIDFGISKQYDEADTKRSTMAATFSRAYAPIEQFEAGGVSKFQPAVDIYSFGGTLYFLLAGVQPPNAFTLLKDELTTVPGASKRLSDTIVAAMKPLQAERLQSIDAFTAMLNAPADTPAGKSSREKDKTIIELEGPEPLVEPADTKPRKKKGTRTLVVVLIVFLVLSVAGVGTFFLVSNMQKEKETAENIEEELTSEGSSAKDTAAKPSLKKGAVAMNEPDVDEDGGLLPKEQYDKEAQAGDTVAAVEGEDVVGTVEQSSDAPQTSQASQSVKRKEKAPAKKDYASMTKEGLALMKNGNYKKAFSLLKDAANSGNAVAQNAVGECYQKGYGVSINYTEAVNYYRMAANRGNADAQYNFAVCYMRGIGGLRRDTRRAFEYFQKAAEQGHAIAQYNMGEMYREGGEVPIDLNKAAEWYRKSAAQGYSYAAERLRMMRR